MDWTDPVQDKDKCRCLVIAVVKFSVPSECGNLLTS